MCSQRFKDNSNLFVFGDFVSFATVNACICLIKSQGPWRLGAHTSKDTEQTRGEGSVCASVPA